MTAATTTPATKEMPEAFPFRLYDMLEDAERKGFDHIVSWLPGGDGFRIHRYDDFVAQILPLYFNQQTKYKSFQRQLNMYEFKTLRGRGVASAKRKKTGKKEDQRGTFSHPMFFRGNRNCCRLVPRKTSGVHYSSLLYQSYAHMQKTGQQQVSTEHDAAAANALSPIARELRNLSRANMLKKMGEPSAGFDVSTVDVAVAQHPTPSLSTTAAGRITGAIDVASAPVSNVLRIWAGRTASPANEKRQLPDLIPGGWNEGDFSSNTQPLQAAASILEKDSQPAPIWYREHEASLSEYTQEAVLHLTGDEKPHAGDMRDPIAELSMDPSDAFAQEAQLNVNAEDVVDEIISTFRL